MPRRSRPFVRSARKTPTWIGPADQSFVAVGSGAKVLIGSASFTDPSTVARTRGEVSVMPSSFAADLSVDGAFGACIVSSDAFGIGATALPGPFSDAGWDGWYMW